MAHVLIPGPTGSAIPPTDRADACCSLSGLCRHRYLERMGNRYRLTSTAGRLGGGASPERCGTLGRASLASDIHADPSAALTFGEAEREAQGVEALAGLVAERYSIICLGCAA
ncbi:hypothetical protein ABT294_22520 [Nonomuraea sp. NPDC000554]|uniref:hypothetical protein n=1 Tax=Nonomuraea sp. NPDC000554 TaxID=3154259 RepID=UPI00331CADB2